MCKSILSHFRGTFKDNSTLLQLSLVVPSLMMISFRYNDKSAAPLLTRRLDNKHEQPDDRQPTVK